MHLYTTPNSAAWTIYTEDQTLGMQWSAPCVYVKLRDGIETCIVINQKTLRVGGFNYEGTSAGVHLTVIGAIARHIGCYDVKHFFGPKAKLQGV
jgi:hypothetical protein